MNKEVWLYQLLLTSLPKPQTSIDLLISTTSMVERPVGIQHYVDQVIQIFNDEMRINRKPFPEEYGTFLIFLYFFLTKELDSAHLVRQWVEYSDIFYKIYTQSANHLNEVIPNSYKSALEKISDYLYLCTWRAIKAGYDWPQQWFEADSGGQPPMPPFYEV